MNKKCGRMLFAFIVCIIGLVISFGALTYVVSAPIKLMPLGDSITQRSYSYRVKLYTLLNPDLANPKYDFVGSTKTTGDQCVDKNHEGWAGWYIQDINNKINTWITLNPPDIVLLHIGTNDNYASINNVSIFNLSKATNSLSGIIDKIALKLPNTKVYIAAIIPLRDNVWTPFNENDNVIAYNNAIRNLVPEKQSQGKKVYFVDMYPHISTATDLSDNKHPNSVGADKMADVWYSYLAGQNPNNTPIASGQSVTTPKDTAKTITLTATDADVSDTLTYSTVTLPVHGTLSGIAPNVTYTPTSGYIGTDSFTFKANDTKADSNTATVSITVTSAEVINLIKNPGFETGKMLWVYYAGGGGEFSTSTPGYNGTFAAKCTITATNANIQLYQTGIELEPNTHYRLSFSAYSTTGHDVTVNLLKNVSPYTNYGLTYTANLGTTWQTFTTEFNTKGFTSKVSDGRLRFWLASFAKAGDIYYIDDVQLSKVTLLGLVPAIDLTTVKLYPNPYNPATAVDGKLKVINLPMNSVMKLYTVAGRFVRELNEVDYGNLGWIEWDGKNSDGDEVAKGVYIYQIEDVAGSKKTGKIGLVK
ncbi:MAG: carbohydrate binding domain-containing protein [Elusimicrobia bacterium]|nr:carbohydrate binding domain-containing protein [Elusimicrobiota bacterium]